MRTALLCILACLAMAGCDAPPPPKPSPYPLTTPQSLEVHVALASSPIYAYPRH